MVACLARSLLVLLALLPAWMGACARSVTCERFGPQTGPLTLVVLHGSSGPEAYRALAVDYAAHGYPVIFPHLFDATKGDRRTDADYAAWVEAVRTCMQAAPADHPVVLFGMSLGASVALAAGTVLPRVDAVVDWSGSLPDTYFEHMQRLPPLLILHGDADTSVPVLNAQQLFTLCGRMSVPCSGTIYQGEGHLFPGKKADADARTLAFLQSRVQAGAAVRP